MDIKKISLMIGMLVSCAGAYYLYQNYQIKHENSEIIYDVVDIMQDQLQHEIEPKSLVDITSQEMLHDILMNKKEPSIIFFHMNGCGWCKKMEPIFQQVAQNPNYASIQFYTANGKDCNAQTIVKELCDQQIQGYPTLIFMNEQGYLDKKVGFAQPEDFEQKINKIYFGQDELVVPVEVQKDIDTVKIQGGDVPDGSDCHGGYKWNGNKSDACDGTGGDGDCSGGKCFSCDGIYAANLASGGSTNGTCNSSSKSCSGHGCGHSCTGKQGSDNGGGTCQGGYICAAAQKINGVIHGYLAVDSQKGVCTFGEKKETDNNGFKYYADSIRPNYIDSIPEQVCYGVADSDQGTCTGGYACVTTTSGTIFKTEQSSASHDAPVYKISSTPKSGDFLIPAGQGAAGICLATTGLQTTTSTSGKAIYTSGGASGSYGSSDMCSQSGTICVGAFEGALGTCCQGDDIMDCMVSDTTVAAYSQLGICMESQQSGNMQKCTGGSSDCPSGYACVYKSDAGDVAAAPTGWGGHCALDNGEYGTANQCSVSSEACLGGTTAGQGTCCPADETGQATLSCLTPTQSAITANEYSSYGEIGSCIACSTNKCTGQVYGDNDQGDCCPGYQCNYQDTNTPVPSKISGYCYQSTATTNCAVSGGSCTYAAGSTQGTCCSGFNLVCVTSDVPGDKGYGVAITNGSGVCMAE